MASGIFLDRHLMGVPRRDTRLLHEPGLCQRGSGLCRSKNTVNILSKNFIVFAVSSLGFLLLGWGLMFGGDNPFIGTEHLFILGSQDLSFYDNTLTSSVPFWGKFFFQLVFCGHGGDDRLRFRGGARESTSPSS